MEAKHVNAFRPNDVMWGKNIQRPVEKSRQTAQKYRHENGLHLQQPIFCQKRFYLWLANGDIRRDSLDSNDACTHVDYELPASSLKCRAHPNVIRRSFEPHDQMLYHRTILEPHMAYPIPAGTHYIVLTVQKTAFGLDIIPESLLPQLIQKGFHVGDFRKMKKFNQTPYKLPPPTPIHVPAEKRPLEEKALPKKRVQPVPIPDVPPVHIPQTPVQIPDVLEPPVPIPDVLEPVPIPDVPPVHIPQTPVQIPDVLEPVQIPRMCNSSHPRTTCADSRGSRTCADSRGSEPVQIPVSHVPQPPMQILPEPMNILHVRSVQIPEDPEPVQIPDDPEPVQILVSQVPQPPMQILPEPMNILHVPVQIPVSHVPQPPMQILPEP
ncbi:uncharacterized protein TNCV_2092591 [Trichonephila clavipes]|nr:uncharacterized protein TNCV_2092591 [Trichonephila clavipes]